MTTTTINKVHLSFAAAFGALLLGGAIMGVSPIFVRTAETSSFVSAFWRVVFALPFLALWAILENRRSGMRLLPSFTGPSLLAGLFFAGDLTFWHLAILNTTMANATFMGCLAPVWVVLLSKFTIAEQTPARAVAGLALCLLGLVLLISASLQFNPARLIGDIYGVITSVFLGLYFLAMRAGRATQSSGSLFFSSTCITAICLFIVALIMDPNFYPETAKGWASLFALGAFTHAGGQGLVTLSLGSLTAMFSSLVIFIEAIAAAIAGWLFFDERLGPAELIGGALILSGVWFARPSTPKN